MFCRKVSSELPLSQTKTIWQIICKIWKEIKYEIWGVLLHLTISLCWIDESDLFKFKNLKKYEKGSLRHLAVEYPSYVRHPRCTFLVAITQQSWLRFKVRHYCVFIIINKRIPTGAFRNRSASFVGNFQTRRVQVPEKVPEEVNPKSRFIRRCYWIKLPLE